MVSAILVTSCLLLSGDQPSIAAEVRITRFTDPLVGQTVTFEAEATPGGGTFEWTVPAGAERVALEGGDTATPTLSGKRVSGGLDDVTVRVKYTVEGQAPAIAEHKVTVVRLTLGRFTLEGDRAAATPNRVAIGPDKAPGDPANFDGPTWLRGRKAGNQDYEGFPVAFLRSKAKYGPKMDKTLNASYIVLTDVRVGVAPSAYNREVAVRMTAPLEQKFEYKQTAANGALNTSALIRSSKALPETVSANTKYGTAWAFAAGAQGSAGDLQYHASEDTPVVRLYVTLDQPKLKKDVRHESLFSIGCGLAAGESTADGAFDKVWAGLASRRVKNHRGETLGYYRGSTYCLELKDGRLVVPGTLAGLVAAANGRCGTWAELLVTVLDMLGHPGGTIQRAQCDPVKRDKKVSIVEMMVKDYDFAGGGSEGGDFPFRLNTDDPRYTKWAPSDTTDRRGVPGQDNADPPALFGDHAIVRVGTRFYDPSYGVLYPEPPKGGTPASVFQSEALAGFYIVIEEKLANPLLPPKQRLLAQKPGNETRVVLTDYYDKNRTRLGPGGRGRGPSYVLPVSGRWSELSPSHYDVLGDLVDTLATSEATALLGGDGESQGLGCAILSELAVEDPAALEALLAASALLESEVETFPKGYQTSAAAYYEWEPATVAGYYGSVLRDWLGVAVPDPAFLSELLAEAGPPEGFVRVWSLRLVRSQYSTEALAEAKAAVSALDEELRWAVVVEGHLNGVLGWDEAAGILRSLSPATQLRIRLREPMRPGDPLFQVDPGYRTELQDLAVRLMDE